MPQLAERMHRAKSSAIMEIADRAKALKASGKDIISFSVGVPNFLPAPHVYHAARQALLNDSGQYLSGRGENELVDAYLFRLRENGFEGFTSQNIASGIGAKHVLFSLLYALLNEGDELIIPTPCWTTYRDIADLLGSNPVYVRCTAEQNYKLNAEQLSTAITPNSKVILINNPSNPTGMVYSEAELKSIGDVLEKHDLWIISDDIYNRMIFDGVGFHHLLKTNPALKDRLIMIDSISKSYGMPGWRVGLMAGPVKIAEAMVTLNSNSVTNIPQVVSSAAAAALCGDQTFSDIQCEAMAQKRDLIYNAISAIEGVTCPKPQGAFYLFPDISCAFGRHFNQQLISDDVSFAKILLDSLGVAVVPGSAFGEPRAIRLSYACELTDLKSGIARIQSFFASLK